MIKFKEIKSPTVKRIISIVRVLFIACLYFYITWTMNIPIPIMIGFLAGGFFIGFYVMELLSNELVSNINALHRYKIELIKQFVPDDKKELVNELLNYVGTDDEGI